MTLRGLHSLQQMQHATGQEQHQQNSFAASADNSRYGKTTVSKILSIHSHDLYEYCSATVQQSSTNTAFWSGIGSCTASKPHNIQLYITSGRSSPCFAIHAMPNTTESLATFVELQKLSEQLKKGQTGVHTFLYVQSRVP